MPSVAVFAVRPHVACACVRALGGCLRSVVLPSLSLLCCVALPPRVLQGVSLSACLLEPHQQRHEPSGDGLVMADHAKMDRYVSHFDFL